MALLLEQVKKLHDSGLLSNIKITAGIVLSALSQCKSTEPQAMSTQCQLLVYYADSIYDCQEYKRAEKYYQNALQLKKNLVKKKFKPSSPTPVMSEVDIRYKIYLCQMKLKDYKSAQKTLDDIPPKQRTPQITMCLAKLYHKLGVERPAIACYKDVLRSCPLALEAAMGLLELGQSATEVNSLMTVCLPAIGNLEWLLTWLKAYSLKTTSKFTKAAQQFKSLETQHLRDNTDVLCLLAECHWQLGDSNNAKAIYKRVRSLDECCLQGMDIYAGLLAQDGDKQEVDSLAEHLIGISEERPEPWIAMAHSSSVANKKTKAIYFSQKAGIVLSALSQCKSTEPQAMATQCQLLVYYADSIYDCQEYKRAEKYYQHALQLKKNLVKKKFKPSSPTPVMSEVDIRYKIYLCQMKLKDYKSAQKTLDDIPPKQRTPQITMCLAKLYHKLGVERPAIACYKDVLRSCPLALEAAMGLLKLGQSATEVNSLMTVCLPAIGNLEWLLTWLKAYSLKTTSKFTKAAQQFKSLETQHLRDNTDVLCLLAECHWQLGDSNNAKAIYKRVRSLDECCLQGMDIYAGLLAQDGDKQEVDRFVTGTANGQQVIEDWEERWSLEEQGLF